MVPVKLNYLESLKKHLRLDPLLESDILKEIRAHLEDRSKELTELGLPEEEASKIVIGILGPPRLVARQMYEVYNQGTWLQSVCAGLPHFLVALLFALHFWQDIFWLTALLLLLTGVTIYGWTHGRPDWLFPWLGYCLAPVIATGALLIYLPGAWSWFALIAYLPLVLILIIAVAKASLKRDWLFTSLMLLPLPITLGWIVALTKNTLLPLEAKLYHFAPIIALSFCILAIAAVAFIRIKQRWAKLGTLIAFEVIVFAIVAFTGRNIVSPTTWVFLALLVAAFLFGPALLGHDFFGNRSRPA